VLIPGFQKKMQNSGDRAEKCNGEQKSFLMHLTEVPVSEVSGVFVLYPNQDRIRIRVILQITGMMVPQQTI
jgi:hypothetical protein